jgi:hypothetical protein
MNMQEDIKPVTASLVSLDSRMDFLPKHFGMRRFITGESMVYMHLRNLCEDYISGAFWHFLELSNGGFYMAPDLDKTLRIQALNGFMGELTADAAGIVATMYALGHLAGMLEGTEEGDPIIDRYHWLREFALDHAECGAIMRAID